MNLVNSESKILSGDEVRQAYTDINVVTQGRAKTGAD